MLYVVLFDLDGTLTDPAVGITASYRHALTEVGVTVADDETSVAIGPPVRTTSRPTGSPPTWSSRRSTPSASATPRWGCSRRS